MAASRPDEEQAATLAVIRLLARNPELTQRELARALGMSLGKLNYCLRALIAKGLVKAENYRNSSNKLGYLYLLTPTGVTEKVQLTRKFLSWKMAEYEALRLEIEALKSEEAQAEAESPQ